MSPWFLQVEAEKRSNRSKTLRLAVRFLHFVEHVIEFSYSDQVSICAGGEPLVAPGENGDVPVELRSGGWYAAADVQIG
jgi:hypothetical protein